MSEQRLCAVPGCTHKAEKGVVRCRSHTKFWRELGKPTDIGALPTCSAYPECGNPPLRAWGVCREHRYPNYSAVHKRLAAWRGDARDHQCRHCGRQAQQWALMDPYVDTRICEQNGRRYTSDLNRYEPLCITCHRVVDIPACKNGHPLVEENVYRPPSAPTNRACLACTRSRHWLERNGLGWLLDDLARARLR